ncbi:helix-turn-helix domain-containing protein, partial [Actinosynnema sp. NPDC059797]
MARRESPLRAEHHGLGEFAAELRKLREQAGGPTYRQLSRQAHYSPAALSEAANGRKLPSLAVTLAYVRACGGEVSSWEARWRALAGQLAAPRPGPDDGRAPYAGLAAFQVEDADRFFGRDRLVGELVELVGRRRCTGVFGASGSGKSSVLRAGLVAASSGPSVVLTPGPRPVEELAVRIAAFTGKPAAALAAEFAAYPENLHLRVRQAVVGRHGDLLLVVDQFEEVFTLCADPAERAAFVAALTTAATAPTSRTRVVLGVRADFLGHCGRHPELVGALRGGHVLVGPMTADELREAVVAPAGAVGCKVETALVTRLVSDAAGQPAALPLVSHALLETWRRRRGVVLTLAAYEEAGGIEHSIARSAEDVYDRMPPERQRVAKQVFLRLIAVGEGTEDTKRRVDRDEVDHPEVLAALAEARLVVLDRDTAELAHEALIHNWPRLRGWIAEDRAGLRAQRMLTDAARTWESLDRDPSALYRGTRLALAREWADGEVWSRLTPGERRFLEACIAADDAVRAVEHRRTRRLRQLVSVMAVLLVLAFSAIAFAVRAERSAREQAAIALAHKVITQAAGLRTADPALSVQLSLAAHRLAGLPETRDAVLGSFAEPYATRITAARSVVVAPSGSLLAVVDDTSTRNARLVDVSDPRRPAHLSELPAVAGVGAVAFHPGGGRVAVAGAGRIALVDVRDPRRPEVEQVLFEPVPTRTAVSLAFSPDGRRLAAGYEDRQAVVRDLGDPVQPRLPARVGGDASHAVAFLSPTALAVLSGDRVEVVDVTTGATTTAVSGVGALTALAVAGSGRLLATAGEDRVVRLWEVGEGPARRLGALRHGADVHAVAFDGTGRVLATAGQDQVTRLWDVTDRGAPVEVAAPTGHLGPVTAVGFAAGGRSVVTAGGDRTVRLVDVADLPFRQGTQVRSVVVAAARELVATVDDEGVLRLVHPLEPSGLRTARVLTEHRGKVRAAALSPDGAHLVTVAEDDAVRVWRVADPAAPVFVGDAGEGRVVAFTPRGHHFDTGGADGWTRLWDVRTLFQTSVV